MPRPLDFSVMPIRANADDFLEKRYSYTVAGLLEYEGWCKKPNGATSANIWNIVKYTYTGTSIDRQQLPDDGPFFKYSWDSRATYFS